MAQTIFRANLTAQSFPLLTDHFGRTVVMPGLDENAASYNIFDGGDNARQKGIPQPFYMHNVLPTTNGLQSVAYDTPITGTGVNSFDNIFQLRDSNESRTYFAYVNGYNYILKDAATGWTSSVFSGPSNTARVTTAYVHGKTYIYYEHYGCYTYDPVAGTFNVVTLNGLQANAIQGICAYGNYLIAWDDSNTIYWSDPTTETQFTPGGTSGAGSEKVNGLRGKVIAALPITEGFVIYTTANVVLAQWSGNSQFPFNFSEISGSDGIFNVSQVSFESNSDYHYAWTASGFMKIDKNSSSTLFPELTDFLSGLTFEDFANNQLTTTSLLNQMQVKVSYVGERYLAISYGPNALTHVLIYDFALKRWGKLKKQHVKVFEFIYPNPTNQIAYRQILGSYTAQGTTRYVDYANTPVAIGQPNKSLALLGQDGTISVVNLDKVDTSVDVALLIGKFELQRQHQVYLLQSDVESGKLDANGVNQMKFSLLPSEDGKTLGTPIALTASKNNTKAQKYPCRNSAMSWTLLLQGCFDVSSIVLTTVEGGYR